MNELGRRRPRLAFANLKKGALASDPKANAKLVCFAFHFRFLICFLVLLLGLVLVLLGFSSGYGFAYDFAFFFGFALWIYFLVLLLDLLFVFDFVSLLFLHRFLCQRMVLACLPANCSCLFTSEI